MKEEFSVRQPELARGPKHPKTLEKPGESQALRMGRTRSPCTDE